MKKIGIIVAMDMELSLLKQTMKISAEQLIGGSTYYEGELSNCPAVVVCCGVGKVNAAVCTTVLCNHFGVTHVVNSGVAGGIDDQILPCDVVISTELVAHDVTPRISAAYFPNTWVYRCDEHLVDLAYHACKHAGVARVFKGRIATGDIYVDHADDKLSIKLRTNPLCVEMEGQAIAQVCHIFKIPFVAVRSISDSSDDNSNFDFEKFAESASKIAAEIVIETAKNLISNQ